MAKYKSGSASPFAFLGWAVLVVLVLVALIMYYKHTTLTQLFAVESLQLQNAESQSISQVQEEGRIIANTIATVPQGFPLFNNPGALESYVLALSEATYRDIVVLDTKKRVVADTVRSEIGTTFSHDTQNQVGQTLRDGLPRTFVEKSTAYPEGINQTVVAIENEAGNIIGALVLSSSTVSLR